MHQRTVLLHDVADQLGVSKAHLDLICYEGNEPLADGIEPDWRLAVPKPLLELWPGFGRQFKILIYLTAQHAARVAQINKTP